MKPEQQQQAQRLYFQTDLTKTEIANLLGISRSSLHSWIRENEWERIKKSGQHMPCLLAENCYFIMAKLQENILSELRVMRPVTLQEVNMINKLSITASRLNRRGTLNENLEMMAHFIEYVNQQNPGMIEAIQPMVNSYIKSRAKVQTWKFMPSKFNEQGFIPATDTVEDRYSDPQSPLGKKLTEDQLDLRDIMDWTENLAPSVSSSEGAEGGRVDLDTLRPTEQQTEPAIPPSPSEVNPDFSSGRAGERPTPSPSEVNPDFSSGRARVRPTPSPLEVNPDFSSGRAGVRPTPSPLEVNPDFSSGRAGVRPTPSPLGEGRGEASPSPLGEGRGEAFPSGEGRGEAPSAAEMYEYFMKQRTEKEEKEKVRRETLAIAEEFLKNQQAQQQKPEPVAPLPPQQQSAKSPDKQAHTQKGKGFNRAWRRKMALA